MTKRIPIIHTDMYALVDDEDYPRLSRYKWYITDGYALRCARIDGKKTMIRMHREVMGATRGQMVDHANGNRLDNRRSNLRLCNKTQNQANSSGVKATNHYKGIYRKRSGWAAQIRIDSIPYYLGTFATAEEAARAYNKAAAEHFGEFARLNDV